MGSKSKKIKVTSINQQGGITAGSVNIGPQPRIMNEQLSNQIKQRIPTSAKVTVIAVLRDGEAFEFANQVLDWLNANGYANTKGVDQDIYDRSLTAQRIKRVSDNEFELKIGTKQ